MKRKQILFKLLLIYNTDNVSCLPQKWPVLSGCFLAVKDYGLKDLKISTHTVRVILYTCRKTPTDKMECISSDDDTENSEEFDIEDFPFEELE